MMLLWSKVKAYSMVILSIALALLYALLKSEQAGRAMDKVKVAQGAAKALSGANKARSEAELRGKERIDEAKKSDPRDHFS